MALKGEYKRAHLKKVNPVQAPFYNTLKMTKVMEMDNTSVAARGWGCRKRLILQEKRKGVTLWCCAPECDVGYTHEIKFHRCTHTPRGLNRCFISKDIQMTSKHRREFQHQQASWENKLKPLRNASVRPSEQLALFKWWCQLPVTDMRL